MSLVLPRPDYGNAVLAGIPVHLQLQQSVMNAATRLIYSSSRFDHITPLLRRLHWLKIRERIHFKLAMLAYKCLHGSAPSYLTDKFNHPAEVEARRQLRSTSSPSLTVRHTRLSTVGDRAFPVAAACACNRRPHDVISTPSLRVFRNRLQTYLFACSFP
jgi:hypothetical protein